MHTSADSTRDASRPGLRARENLAVVLWAAFLAACVETLFFFALFDPALLAHDAAPPAWLEDRMTGYALGFFFFWAICTIAGLLTAYLIETRTAPQREER
jgi:hypothetical protein